jgi:hypothetical protein
MRQEEAKPILDWLTIDQFENGKFRFSGRFKPD